MHGTDLIVEVVAALVETPKRGGQRLAQKRRIDLTHPTLHRHGAADVECIEQPSRVAVGQFDQHASGIPADGHGRKLLLQRALKQFSRLLLGQALQLIHRRTA